MTAGPPGVEAEPGWDPGLLAVYRSSDAELVRLAHVVCGDASAAEELEVVVGDVPVLVRIRIVGDTYLSVTEIALEPGAIVGGPAPPVPGLSG